MLATISPGDKEEWCTRHLAGPTLYAQLSQSAGVV